MRKNMKVSQMLEATEKQTKFTSAKFQNVSSKHKIQSTKGIQCRFR